MSTPNEQSPRQDLPDGGTALPSRGTKPEGGSGEPDPPQNSMTPTRARKSRSTGPVAEGQDAANRLQRVKDLAQAMVENRKLLTSEVHIFMRQEQVVKDLSLKDDELQTIITQAIAKRDGKVTEIRRGDKINMRPIQWFWEGILKKGGCNMIFGDPKTGKTRLVLGLLGNFLNGAGSFLGRQLTDEDSELMIVGPDMSEDSWGAFLNEFHLCKPDGSMHERIRSVITRGFSFRLDSDGIDKIVNHCKESPGLVILMDSLTTVMAGLGYDENRPQYVEPLEQLMDAIAPYNATLIVIHHSKKENGGGSMSTMARGSSALSAKVDVLVSLKQFKPSQYAEPTGEIEIYTEGRVGKRQSLLAAWDEEASCWASRGSRTDALKEHALLEEGAKLKGRQLETLIALIQAYEVDQTPPSATELTIKLGLDPDKERTKVYGYLEPLIQKKGYVVEAGVRKSGPCKGEKTYKPTQKALAWDRCKQ